jgi:hypothetical protein
MTPKVCILDEDDARSFTCDIAHRCASRRHHHYGRSEVIALVQAGELAWVKTYIRNEYGEVIACTMQLVPGGGGF